ncbi:MAG: hypothetical protein K1X53_12255 [Candidatus Sumerlaeaceae bacterium]|nr:hypothetical protein [Candidatus Sumerlaeaceae bacterium]
MRKKPMETIVRIAAMILSLACVWDALAGEAVPTPVEPTPVNSRGTSGNISLQGASGLDKNPVKSPDGSLMAFVGVVPDCVISTPGGKVAASEIWIARTDGTSATQLVKFHESQKPEDVLAGFGNLRFSADGKTLFFTSFAWEGSHALKCCDLSTGKVRHIAPSNGFEILGKGKYKGYFVSLQRRKDRKRGIWYKYCLMSPQGVEVRDVGDELRKAVATLEKS